MAFETFFGEIGEKKDSENVLDRLRGMYAENQEFDQFLYGGLHDLEDPVGPLIYVLWKGEILNTKYSCGGHVGSSLDIGASLLDGHFVYKPGVLLFEGDDLKTKNFIGRSEKIFTPYPYAKLTSRPPSDLLSEKMHQHQIILEMEDISKAVPDNRWSATGTSKEIPAEIAKKRLSEVAAIWEKLTMEALAMTGVRF